MSCNENKVALRAEIKSLQDKNYDEALKYFQPILGDPDDIDEDQNGCCWFFYEDKVGRFVPVRDYDSKKWGLDLILAKGDDHNSAEYFSMSLTDIEEKIKVITDKFLLSKEDVFLVCYTWYNGADEPIEFK